MEILFRRKERTPLGFCDGLDKIFVGFGSKDEKGCQPPKYHTSYAPFYPIHKAASLGDVDAVRSFVERGIFVMEQTDWKYRTALHFACVYGHPEVVTFLVENSCEISPKDIKEATPLIKAAQCKQTKCLEILLKHGADPNIIDCCANTALHYTVYNGDVETAAKLLEYQANVEAINENKITPLLLALKQNKEKMAEFLINKGANANTCDFLGRSTLMYAVRCGSELIIKLLLQRGIDTFKQDAFGWTAKRYAIESKSKVRKLLIDYDEREQRQTCSEIMTKDACSTPFLPTAKVKDPPQSEGVEKTEATPSKSENTEKDACSKPTTEVEDSPQSEAMEKAEARSSKLEPGLQVSSEKNSKKHDHQENNQSLRFFERVFWDGHCSETREENGKDITEGRVLAWVENDDLSKPRTTERKISTDEVEIIMLKSFKSELVIEMSSEEERKGDDDDDSNGIEHQQHLEEETKEAGGKSNQESPSNKKSIFQKEVEDSAEDSEGVATEQPLGKDEEPKAQKDKDSNDDTEEEARKQSVQKSNQGSPYKKSILQKFEDSSDYSESIFECLAKKSSDHFQGATDQSGDEHIKKSPKKYPLLKSTIEEKDIDPKNALGMEDTQTLASAKSDLEVTSSENQKTHSDSMASSPLHFTQKEEMDGLTGSASLQGQNMATGQMKAEPVTEATSEEEEESDGDSDSTQTFRIAVTYGLKNIWEYLRRIADPRTQNKATGEMNELKEVASRDKQRNHESSASDHSWTTSDPLPQKVDASHSAGSRDQREENSARKELKGNEVTSIEKLRRHESSESIESLPTSESPLQRQDVGHLPKTDDPRRETTGNGKMKDFSKEDPSQLKPTIKKKSSFLNRAMAKRHERSWESADPDKEMTSTEEQRSHVIGESVESLEPATDCTEQKEDVSHLAGAGGQGRENLRRYTMGVALCREVTITEEQSRQDNQKSVQSSVVTELHPLKEDIVHFAGIPGQEKGNIASMEMKASSIEVTSTQECKINNSFECTESMKRDESHLPGTTDQRRNNIKSGEIKESTKDYLPQFKTTIQRESSFEYTAVISLHQNTCESEEPGNEEPSREELTRHEDHQSVQSWTTSETFSQEDNVVYLVRTTDERPEDVTNAEVQGVPDKGMISPEQQKHDRHENSHSLATSETTTYMEDVVHFSADQILENMTNAEIKAKPDKEVISAEEQTRHYNSKRQQGKEDVCHFAVAIKQRSENGEMEDLCKEVTLTEEQRRHAIHGGVQSLIIPEILPQKNVIHLAVTTDHRIENKSTTEVKAKPDRGVMTSTEEQIRHESSERLGSLAISESLPQRSNVGHLAASEQQRKKNGTNAEREVFQKESPTQFKPIIEMEYSHLNQAIEKMTGRTCQPAINKEVASAEKPRRSDKDEKVPSTKEGHIAETVDQRREAYTCLEMNGPCKEETSTADERKYDSCESVQSLILSETLTQKKAVVHSPKTADQRGENVASGQKKAERNLHVTSREDQNKDDSSNNSQLSLKQKKKTGCSTRMNTVEKPFHGNTAAVGGSGADAAAAISGNGVRNGFIPQRHCGKAGNHQFPVTTKKHAGLNKKTCDEKNKTVEHMDAMDDHQFSRSVSEDDDLHIDNLLMIADQLQMNCKDSERLLEAKDAVHPHKMITECNQSQSELLIGKSKKMKNQASEVLKKPRETEKGKSQLRCQNEEQQLELTDVGPAGKQEARQRNAHYLYEKIKKQITEKEEQCKKELEMRLGAQDMKLRHLRNDMNKLQEARDQEAEAEDSDRMSKKHLQRIEQEIFKLKETIKKQAETIQQLEKELLSKDKGLIRTDSLIQSSQEFFANFRAMYSTSVMNQLELRIQSLESKIFEMKIQTRDDVMVLENSNKFHQSHKLRETEAQLKEVTDQFLMLSKHNMTLLNVLNSILASKCPCAASFHSRSGSLFTQENAVTPTSGPHSSKQHVTANLGESAGDSEDFNQELINLVVCPQAELDHTEKKHMELAKEKTLSKKCFKWTKTSAEHENGEQSFSDVSNTMQFEKDNLVHTPRHEIIAEDQETFHNILENQNDSFISPWESRFTNLQPEYAKETTHQALYKAESKQYEDLYLEWIEMTNISSHEQLRSKDRQDEAMRSNFGKMELCGSAANTYTMSPTPGLAAEHLNNSWGHSRSFVGREPLIPSSNPQPFAKSLTNFLNRVREENQQTFNDIIGNCKASGMRAQKSTVTNLQSKHPEELTHQISYKAEPKQYEDPYLEMVEMTKSLSHEQLKSKDRQDEAMRSNFGEIKLCGSAPNMTSPAPGFAAGRPHNSQKHSGSFIQGEPLVPDSRPSHFKPLVPGSRPSHFVESLDSYLGRTWQQLNNDYY